MKHRMQVTQAIKFRRKIIFLLSKAQTRCLNRRTTDLLGACNFPHGLESSMSRGSEVSSQLQPPPRNGQSHERRVELFPNAEQVASTAGFGIYSLPPFMRSLTPFFAVGDGGPPPYTSQTQRVRRSRNDVLPPLPSYEAATKLPVIGESQSESGQELQHQERQGHELFNPQLPNEAQIEHEEGIIEAPIEERIRTGHGELLELQERNKDKLPSAESNHCQAETQNR
uniref:MADS-box domain-containing protein n=1 Tax=Meloidogyne hapla TaxID=6305 RepID=A0A1I8BKW3_MELHA